MAKATLRNTLKFKGLVARLSLPSPAYVQGLLESLWDSAHSKATPLLGGLVDLESAAEWPGERGVLAAALVELGFVDEIVPGRLYAVHDYYDHAPKYVKERIGRLLKDDPTVSIETFYLPRATFERALRAAGIVSTAEDDSEQDLPESGDEEPPRAATWRAAAQNGSPSAKTASVRRNVALSRQGKARQGNSLTPVAPALAPEAHLDDVAPQPPDPELALATGRAARLIAELAAKRPAAADALDGLALEATTLADWREITHLAERELAEVAR